MLTVVGLLVYSIIQRQVRLYLCIHAQQVPGNKGATAPPTAAVVLALFAQVALVHSQVHFVAYYFLPQLPNLRAFWLSLGTEEIILTKH
jgi:hypothetical protein